MKTLCLDFGNTRLKAAIFINNIFSEEFILTDENDPTINLLIEKFQPEKSILSSVINHTVAIEHLLEKKTSFHKLSSVSKLNFTSSVGKPETIGADRLALAAAAVHFFPNQNNLIICLGSCVTYNFINQYHQFLGGAISPGMQMRYKAMHQFTAKLPLIEQEAAAANWNFPIIGYDTKTNLQSGVLAGISFEIKGYIDFYASKYDNFNVVLTGGNAGFFARHIKKEIFADLNFLFKGLYAISEANNC